MREREREFSSCGCCYVFNHHRRYKLWYLVFLIGILTERVSLWMFMHIMVSLNALFNKPFPGSSFFHFVFVLFFALAVHMKERYLFNNWIPPTHHKNYFYQFNNSLSGHKTGYTFTTACSWLFVMLLSSLEWSVYIDRIAHSKIEPFVHQCSKCYLISLFVSNCCHFCWQLQF